MADILKEDPARGTHSIIHAADALQFAAEPLVQKSGRWSIAELNLSEADIGWLQNWARSLLPQQASMNLQYSSRAGRFGLLFLSLAAEVCRRDAREDAIWPTILGLGWSDEVRRVLFTSQGGPRAVITQAIESACDRFRLRNNVGDEGRQHWFTTIKLQFGMTRSGMTEHLGAWLYQDTLPTAAELLCHGEMASTSFAEAANGLREYQRGYVPEAQLRTKLQLSPWILNEWIDDVVAAAGEKPDSTDTPPELRNGPGEELTELDGEIDDARCVLEPQLVRTESGEVEFVAEISADIDQLCTTDRYFVSVDEDNTGCFFRQANGSFVPFGESSREVQIPADCGFVCITIADGESKSLAVQVVELFDPAEDFEAWCQSQDGRFQKVDCHCHEFRRTRGYAFRVPLDAVAEPHETLAGEFRTGHNRWVFVAPGWDADLRLTLDGIEMFAHQEVHRTSQTPPEWTRSIRTSVLDTNWNTGCFRVRICVGRDIRIAGLRVFGRPIELASNSNSTLTTAPIPIELERPDGRFDLQIVAVHQDTRYVIRRHCHLTTEGLLRFEAGRWQRIPKTDEVNVDQLRRGIFLVRPPHANEQTVWIAHEGYREVNVPVNRPGAIRDASGWGQSLTLQKGRYNQPPGAKCVPLAGRIVNRGCIRDCVDLAVSSSVIVRLRDPIELSSDHRLVVWTNSGQLAAIAPPDLHSVTSDGTWQFDWANTGLEFGGCIAAIAVAYRGRRLGAWWADDWSRSVRDLVESGDPFEAAARARWFQLPLLDQDHARLLRKLTARNGLAFAKAWLVWQDDGENHQRSSTDRIEAMPNLRPPAAEPAWCEVVREMFRDWSPTTDEALKLANEFEISARRFDVVDETSGWPLSDLVERIGEAAPLLLGRLIAQWLDAHLGYAAQTTVLMHGLRGLLGGHADHYEDTELDRDSRLPDLPLSSPFVNQLLETASELSRRGDPARHEAENLQRLLQHPSVSRLVACHLLSSIEVAQQ